MADAGSADGSENLAAAQGRGLIGWLRRVPVADPVDRRNAPTLQVILLLLGILPPLLWLYRTLATDIPWRPGELTSMLVSLAVSAVALFGVLLIRRGHFQWAIRQSLALIALAMILSYWSAGIGAQSFERPLQVTWIALAGLMIGRRGLWIMFGAVALAYVAGAIHDGRFSGSPMDTAMNLATMAVVDVSMFLFIALVVDRGVKTLNDALATANLRGDALAQSNCELEAEVEEHQRTQQQLVHAQKVEAVGRLASGVAHDFNHLLSLVLGYAAKGRRSEDPDELQKALAGVEAAGRRGTAVVDKLLQFSRKETRQVERFDVVKALHDLKPLLRQLFDPLIRVVHDLPKRQAMVEFDRAQLDLVVLNIAANANLAMANGGTFELILRIPGDEVEIELRDSGIGMDQAVLARLFEPFFTTRPTGGGVGLGLSVAHDLVSAAGGSITAHSKPRHGSTFLVRLPTEESVDA